jgi:hypothetical protein
MAFFKWLFGGNRLSSAWSPGSASRWTVSENGNPTFVEGSTRITIFQQDRGWKYCIADVNDRDDPYFSDAYASEREAREEALAHFRGEPSRHQSLTATSYQERRRRWETQIQERSLMIEELRRFLAENKDLGISALRKPEAKIASQLKQLNWQIAEYLNAGVSANFISLAEQQRPALDQLAKEVAARIEIKLGKRPLRIAPMSDSQLSTELAKKVDDLIQLFANTPVVDSIEVERRYRRAMRNSTAKMLDGGLTFGRAFGAPEFMNQDEEAFRDFIKAADQDLAWQCSTVSDAFQRYLETGEKPAPHYPMRVAVLLSKAKDFDREKEFLAAWCMHFPSGNGATYAALVERAKKVGAIIA